MGGSSNTLQQIYFTFAESPPIVWGPHFKGDMKAIERVQKLATRTIPVLKDLRYTERLKALDLRSLEYLRKKSDMIMYYNIVTGKIEINRDDQFTSNQHKHIVPQSK